LKYGKTRRVDFQGGEGSNRGDTNRVITARNGGVPVDFEVQAAGNFPDKGSSGFSLWREPEARVVCIRGRDRLLEGVAERGGL